MDPLRTLNPFAATSEVGAPAFGNREEQGFGALFDSLLSNPATMAGSSALSSSSAPPPNSKEASWLESLANAQQRRREAWTRLTGGPMPASSMEMEQAAREMFQAGLIDTDTYMELTASPFDSAQGDVWKEEGNGSSTQAFFDTYMQQVAQQAMMKLKG